MTNLGGFLRADDVVVAFNQKPASENEREMIEVMLNNPGRTAPFLSSQMRTTVKRPWRANTFSMQFGNIAKRRIEFLPEPPMSKLGAGVQRYILILADIDVSGRFTMRPQAVEGFAMLGIHASRTR